MTLAGLVAKPERHDLVRMAKAFRRAERQATREQDRKIVAAAGLRLQRQASSLYAAVARAAATRRTSTSRPELHQERVCYVCKKPFAKVHRYYDSMCDDCGDFNYAKREQTADLAGHYALITGARVKIGFQASLKLLRAGAHVIVTTRFPVDAAERYSPRAGLRAVPRAAADSWPGSAAHAECRDLHALPARAAAAARLHTQQRVSDRAAPGRVLLNIFSRERPAR